MAIITKKFANNTSMPITKYSGLIYFENALGFLLCKKNTGIKEIIWFKKAIRNIQFFNSS